MIRLPPFLPLLALTACSSPRPPPIATTDLGARDDLATVRDAAGIDAVDVPAASDASVSDSTVLPDTAVDAAMVTDVPAMDAPAMDAPAIDAGLLDTGSDIDLAADAWTPLGSGPCRPRARRVPAILGFHVDPDAGPIAWLTNPPSSGDHFPTWARWGAWPDIPRGNWVHNLEHGGVAMLYRCTPTGGGCPDVRNALVAAMNMIPADPACAPMDAGMPNVRVVITNDALIPTPIAASAWGALYEAECVDAPSLVTFYTMFAAHAPEDFCADGFVP